MNIKIDIEENKDKDVNKVLSTDIKEDKDEEDKDVNNSLRRRKRIRPIDYK